MGQQQEDESPRHAPELSKEEVRRVEKAVAVAAPVIHEVILQQGEEELERTTSALAWSGLAAGLSMGASLIAEGVLTVHLPRDAAWAPLIAKVGYSIGFLIVILGRQQLFTENTLTAVVPVLVHRDRKTLVKMLHLWGVVLGTNLVGTFLIALVLSHTSAFDEGTRAAFSEIGRKGTTASFATVLLRGIFAGWLIALIVWLLPAVPTNRLWIIIIITWLVGAAELSHIVAGSIDAMYVALTGEISWGHCLGGYVAPALIGNVIGGTALVAALNHAQVVAGGGRKH